MILTCTLPRVHMFDLASFLCSKSPIKIEGEGGKPPDDPQTICFYGRAEKMLTFWKENSVLSQTLTLSPRVATAVDYTGGRGRRLPSTVVDNGIFLSHN